MFVLFIQWGCKIDLLIATQISLVHKIDCEVCCFSIMKTLDAWFETYIPQSWVLCHILTKWWIRGRRWTGLRMLLWWGDCILSGAQWPLMPQPQVLCGPKSQNWWLLHLPGVCENRLQMGKTLTHFPTTGKHYRPWIFQMSKKNPQRTTHRIRLL